MEQQQRDRADRDIGNRPRRRYEVSVADCFKGNRGKPGHAKAQQQAGRPMAESFVDHVGGGISNDGNGNDGERIDGSACPGHERECTKETGNCQNREIGDCKAEVRPVFQLPDYQFWELPILSPAAPDTYHIPRITVL